MELSEPNVRFRPAFLKAYSSLKSYAEKIAWLNMGDAADLGFPERDFQGYVNALLERKKSVEAGSVCDTSYWAFDQDEMVGRISILHELNSFLKLTSGHIGFFTHPNFRKRGVASWMLSEVLKTDRAKSIGKLLLTCDDGNLASEKTILKKGGIYSRTVEIGPGDRKKKHFWITLSAT